jgi:hypothetical protein
MPDASCLLYANIGYSSFPLVPRNHWYCGTVIVITAMARNLEPAHHAVFDHLNYFGLWHVCQARQKLLGEVTPKYRSFMCHPVPSDALSTRMVKSDGDS